MKKIAVVSDSHYESAPLSDLAEEISRHGDIGLLIHLGDMTADADWLAGRLSVPVRSVPGNCDRPGPDEPAERVEKIEGVRVLYAHGHTLSVKTTLNRLFYRAQAEGAGLALFGHTHAPLILSEGPVWLVNPGALMDRRWALIELDGGRVLSAKPMRL